MVAHFYMDPEVQGVLTSAREQWPHIHISDSLVMADSAVRMAEQGCRAVTVLGVDFMSENVRAILDEAGYQHIPVSVSNFSVSVRSSTGAGIEQQCSMQVRQPVCCWGSARGLHAQSSPAESATQHTIIKVQ